MILRDERPNPGLELVAYEMMVGASPMLRIRPLSGMRFDGVLITSSNGFKDISVFWVVAYPLMTAISTTLSQFFCISVRGRTVSR